MSYRYGKRSDPPTRLVPADEPVNRVRAPASSDSRKGQRAAEHRRNFNLTTASLDEADAAALDALRVVLDDREAGSYGAT